MASNYKWYSLEVVYTSYNDAKLNALRLYMYERGITHNASAAFNLVRFDIYTDEQGADAINRFLDEYDEQHGRAAMKTA